MPGSRRDEQWRRDERLRPHQRRLPVFLLGASYVGFVISLYLTLVHYRGYIAPCHVVHGCEVVQTSRYSVILGIPVALAGAVFFTLMLYLGSAC